MSLFERSGRTPWFSKTFLYQGLFARTATGLICGSERVLRSSTVSGWRRNAKTLIDQLLRQLFLCWPQLRSWVANARVLSRRSRVGKPGCHPSYFSIQSAHFATGSLPHGMIGTEEVEFFGDPSMIRSL
jgi:hypothetical protein